MIRGYFDSAMMFYLFPNNKYTKDMLVNWYSEKLLAHILKLKSSKTRFNKSRIKTIIEYSASFSVLRDLGITVDYKNLKEVWPFVEITKQHLAIFKEYEDIYAILNKLNSELAMNLFAYKVFPKIVEQTDSYISIMLEFGDYESLLLKIEKQEEEFKKCSIVYNTLSVKNKTMFMNACNKTKLEISGDANW